jgi:hypothetical protein
MLLFSIFLGNKFNRISLTVKIYQNKNPHYARHQREIRVLVSCSAYFSTLICSSETSVDFQRTTWRYIPQDSSLRNDCCEKLKSYCSRLYLSTLANRPVLSALVSTNSKFRVSKRF